MRILLIMVTLWQLLAAQNGFEEGMALYRSGAYAEAMAQFKSAYRATEDEDAAYMIAKMYEKGEGVKADPEAAAHWYRRSAQHYFLASSDSSKHRENKRMLNTYRELDPVEDNETAETIRKVVVSDFGLRPYRANYLLPFGFRTGGTYESYTPSDSYGKVEAELQLSFRLDFFPNLLGLNEIYTLTYTQRSFWQVYEPSAPFRETNYNPEAFVTFPVLFLKVPIKAFSVGFAHQSNGQGNITKRDINTSGVSNSQALEPYLQNRSRSWNYLWGSAIFQFGSVFTEFKAWYRIPDSGEDDNPGLTEYIGNGQVKLILPYGKSMTTLILRQSFTDLKGAQQLSWTYPFSNKENVFWYAKVFTGYGESLIDYNNYLTKFSMGFSFSR